MQLIWKFCEIVFKHAGAFQLHKCHLRAGYSENWQLTKAWTTGVRIGPPGAHNFRKTWRVKKLLGVKHPNPQQIRHWLSLLAYCIRLRRHWKNISLSSDCLATRAT